MVQKGVGSGEELGRIFGKKKSEEVMFYCEVVGENMYFRLGRKFVLCEG